MPWYDEPIRPPPVSKTRVAGDDSGYRDIPTSPLDLEDPDPLEVVTTIHTCPVYKLGARAGLTREYQGGLPGASDHILLRAPAIRAIEHANELVEATGYQIAILDGFRSASIQAALWTYTYHKLAAMRRIRRRPSIQTEIDLGLLADQSCSYAPVLETNGFKQNLSTLLREHGEELSEAGEKYEMTPTEASRLYLTFIGNKHRKFLLDEKSPTAHGSGGSADLWLFSRDGYANLGAPFDYVSPIHVRPSPAEADYFDRPGITVRDYRLAVDQDPVLQQYLREHKVTSISADLFAEIRANRRILFNAMMRVGATHYNLEAWHFNLGNEIDGKQAKILYGHGNSCHAILNRQHLAVWGNEAAHLMAKKVKG